jgi:ribonuclease P protein component
LPGGGRTDSVPGPSPLVVLVPVPFPKTARLLDSSAFTATLQGKRLARTPHFSLHAAPSPTQAPRLGLIVGKRMEKKAVRRNAIKRVLREAFRLARPTLRADDLVVKLNAPFARDSLVALKREVRSQADRLLAAAAQRPEAT